MKNTEIKNALIELYLSLVPKTKITNSENSKVNILILIYKKV